MFNDRVWMKVYSQAVNTNGERGENKFDVIGCPRNCDGARRDAAAIVTDPPPPFNSVRPIEANSPGGWLPLTTRQRRRTQTPL